MPQLIEAEEAHESDDARRDQQRAILRQCLDEIALNAASALQGAGLTFPLYFAVPASGFAMLTFMTPGDPSEEAWETVTKIICEIVSSKIEVADLIGRALRCAPSVNATEATGSGG